MSPKLSKAMYLARLSLAFGRVERATFHEEGSRPETDTDHTVMLGLVACELAPPYLDRAKIAAYALVHDLAEVYAGDTQTLTISDTGLAAKAQREAAARKRLVSELGMGSWIAETLATYEKQCEPEARWVRLVDKIVPKLTHAGNECLGARRLTNRSGFVEAHRRQFAQLADEYPDFVGALELLREAMDHAESCWPAPAQTRECRHCKHWGADPDGAYCTQPTVAHGYQYGIALHTTTAAARCPAPEHPHFESRKGGAQ